MTRFSITLFATVFAFGCHLDTQLGVGAPSASASPGPASSSAPAPRRVASRSWIKLPNIIGMSLAKAKRTLRKAGFTGRFHVERNHWCGFSVPSAPGAVCRTRPYVGQPIGRSVNLLLAGPARGEDSGGTFAQVPQLLNMPVAKAQALLKKQGFKRVRVDTTYKKKNPKAKLACKPGRVCFQHPAAQVRHHHRQQIRLQVGASDE